MINLEWLRTFRSVYKTKSLSKAAEMLMISQPTVSQHIAALESKIGKKLFDRKSKGVIETDMGRMLNTMVSGSIEILEDVENKIVKRNSKLKNIITIGVSQHLYKTTLCSKILSLGDYVHIKFDTKKNLIRSVEEGNLLYAIVPDTINTFDTYCHHLTAQKIVLVGTPDIDFLALKKLYKTDKRMAEKWLDQHKWYAHDNNSNFIKIFWLNIFDKKRPSIIPNYIIPNEYEVLFQQSTGSGLSVAFDATVESFSRSGKLQTCELKEVVHRDLSLISNKKKTTREITNAVLRLLKKNNRSN